MTGLTHMAVAAAIYRRGRFPVPALLAAGFSTHFFLDRIPHHELGLWANIFLGLAGMSIIFYLSVRDGDYLLPAAAIMGLLPDGLVQTSFLPWFNRFHTYCHFHDRGTSAWLLLMEFAIAAVSFLILEPKKGKVD